MAREIGGAVASAGPLPAPDEVHREKVAWARAHPGDPIPSNVAWAERAGAPRAGIRRKPTRTLSGVAIVAVMTAPARCPHGRCTYCPGGVESASPQSYTGEEPSALRGAQFGYDARAITEHRLATLATLGHPTSKVEVILMGGTFPARPKRYRDEVVQGVFDGLNGSVAPSLAEAQHRNETADRRCVSLTVETRPDWCDGRILPDLLAAGVTRVEIGVECLREEVLRDVGRAHGVAEVRSATREARDRGLKVAYHLMLGLPGMDPARDLADYRAVVDDPAYRPDMVKIYPTLVLPGTPLFADWAAGTYAPYETATARDLLAEIKAITPPWIRIQRIQRDIPARLIAAGVRASNLRQLAADHLRASGRRCRCLRCREVGRGGTPDPADLVAGRIEYPASDGVEVFLSFEDPTSDTVAGFLRLRFPSAGTEGGLDAPVIRELKVLGPERAVGSSGEAPGGYQHRGLGRALVERAEQEARDRGSSQLYVMSAVGTREYYRRLGFSTAGAHMMKSGFS